MRVIGGQFRSRSLIAPPGRSTRPTSDRLRETLFNVLGARVDGARVADLYAGSGAVGIEALSRRAATCLFVERGPAALVAIRKNLTSLGLLAQASLGTHSVSRSLQEAVRDNRAFDLVFLDPPYESATEYQATLLTLAGQQGAILAKGALVIAEHARRTSLLERYDPLVRQRVLEQGDAALSFYTVQVEDGAAEG